MAWLESHQALATHRKTLKVMGLTGLTDVEVVGHLHFLWWWGLDNASSDGHLPDVSRMEVGLAAKLQRPSEDIAAFITAGFIDENDSGLSLHDWDVYAGKLIERRQADAKRKRESRTSHARPADIQRPSARTQPNPTQPNSDPTEPPEEKVPAAVAAQAPPSGHSVEEYKKGITQFSRMGQRVKFLVDMVRFELPEEPHRSDDGDLASQLLKSAGDPELAVANLWKALDPVIEGSRFRYAIGITTSENGKQTAEGQRLIVGLPELCDCSHYQRQHQKIHRDGPCSVVGCGCQAWQAQEVNDEA